MGEVGDNVIPLPGFLQAAKAGEPVPEIIELLKDYLARAERGELVGVALAGILWDGLEPRQYATTTSWERTGSYNTASAMDTAINKLARRYAQYLDE